MPAFVAADRHAVDLQICSNTGVSASKGTVAFPWGCGYIPLPDGPSLYTIAHEELGVAVSENGELLWRLT